MLRNLNQSISGRRILGTPYVGILAAQIAAETAGGDNGPGILYDEAIDPQYAGKYLRAQILDWPVTGSLSVAENGAITAEGLADGKHAIRYNVYADGVLQGISTFEINIGAVDATAAGAALTGAAVLDAGTAAGSQSATAPGIDLSGNGQLAPGNAAGSSAGTAPGSTLTGSAQLQPGAASGTGAGTAPGVDLSGAADLIPGGADGAISGTAPGATLAGDAIIVPGGAQGDTHAAAPGADLSAAADLIPGTANNGAPTEPGPLCWTIRALPRLLRVSYSSRRPGDIMTLSAKDPAETIPVTFDFSEVTATIASATIEAKILNGCGGNSSSILSGAPGVAGSHVMQRITGGHAGSTYALRCRAVDSDGNVYVLAAALPVKNVVP